MLQLEFNMQKGPVEVLFITFSVLFILSSESSTFFYIYWVDILSNLIYGWDVEGSKIEIDPCGVIFTPTRPKYEYREQNLVACGCDLI